MYMCIIYLSLAFYCVTCFCNDSVGKQPSGAEPMDRIKSRKLGWLDMNSAWPFGGQQDADKPLLGQSALHQSTGSLHTSASGQAGLNLNGNSRQVDGQMQQLIHSNCIGQQGMMGSQKDINGDQNQNLHSMQQKVCLDGTIQQDFGHQNQQQGGHGDGLQQQAHKQELDLGSHKMTQVGAQQQQKSDGFGQQQQGLLQGISEKTPSGNLGNMNNRPRPQKPKSSNIRHEMNKPGIQNAPYNPNRNWKPDGARPHGNGGSMSPFNNGESLFSMPSHDFNSGFGQNPLFGDPYLNKKPSQKNKKVPNNSGFGNPGFGNFNSGGGRPPFAYGRVDDQNLNDDAPPSRHGSRYYDNKKPPSGGHSTFPHDFPNMYSPSKKMNSFQGMPIF